MGRWYWVTGAGGGHCGLGTAPWRDASKMEIVVGDELGLESCCIGGQARFRRTENRVGEKCARRTPRHRAPKLCLAGGFRLFSLPSRLKRCDCRFVCALEDRAEEADEHGP